MASTSTHVPFTQLAGRPPTLTNERSFMSASNLSYCPCANATTITLAAHAHQNNSTVTAISDSDCPNNSLAVKEQGEWLKIENCLLS
jgi:hypothetical protein